MAPERSVYGARSPDPHRKPETVLADTLTKITTWPDERSVEPAEFKIATTGFPGIAFDIQFHSEGEAHLFEREFT
jgi:hypothetical protein